VTRARSANIISRTGVSSVKAPEPFPPSHCKASLLHNERIALPSLGDGAVVLDEEAGWNMAVGSDVL
jgi:hypothetical protein